MVYISSEKRLPSLWRHTSHHKEGTLHNTISKSLPPENTKILPPENIKWSLRTIFFPSPFPSHYPLKIQNEEQALEL